MCFSIDKKGIIKDVNSIGAAGEARR